MTCHIHFSGSVTGDTGPAIVNRSYLAHCAHWLHGEPNGPSFSNTWKFLRLHRLFSGVLVSSTSAHHLVLMLAARILGRETWYLAHGVARVEMRINRSNSIKHRFVEALTLRLATGVICVSETLREQLVFEFPSRSNRLHVVPNGSESLALPRNLVNTAPNGMVRLMTVGTKPIKNLATLCAAIGDADLGPIELIVVGELQEDSHWVRELPFVKNFRRLSHDETLAWMGTSDIYVQISLFDSFGLAVCEAAQQGCDLLLSTSVGCVPFIPTLRAQNLVVDPYDTVLIASRLRHLVALARTANLTRHVCARKWSIAAGELQELLCHA